MIRSDLLAIIKCCICFIRHHGPFLVNLLWICTIQTTFVPSAQLHMSTRLYKSFPDSSSQNVCYTCHEVKAMGGRSVGRKDKGNHICIPKVVLTYYDILFFLNLLKYQTTQRLIPVIDRMFCLEQRHTGHPTITL